jgi:hypothetical protein
VSTYHRNFEMVRAPHVNGRPGGYITAPALQNDGVTPNSPLLIGAPVKVDTNQAVDGVYGLQPVIAATGAQVPLAGLCGLTVYEFKNDEAFAGFDPYLTTFSDLAFVPASSAVQLISGIDVEVRFRNTSALTFLNTRTYAARTMVAGFAGATNSIFVGSYLTPGTGNDASGYWEVTGSVGNPGSNAWLVVTAIDTTRGECTARFLF